MNIMQMENGIMNITQENKELLFKDLSARLPYHVRVKVWLKDGTTEEGVLDLEHNYADVLRDAFYYNKIVDIKPYLRPMSSMTEEEISDLQKINSQFCFDTFDNFAYVGAADDGFCSIEEMSNILNYLNSHHFDYRGLIEKNLAIEDTKENNSHK